MGNFQEALACLEKRLVVLDELGNFQEKCTTYADLSFVHNSLEHLEQAISCLEHQRDIAR